MLNYSANISPSEHQFRPGNNKPRIFISGGKLPNADVKIRNFRRRKYCPRWVSGKFGPESEGPLKSGPSMRVERFLDQ
jgi:hypothetical protein